MQTIHEPAREIPIARDTDVIVVGGGRLDWPPQLRLHVPAHEPHWWSSSGTWRNGDCILDGLHQRFPQPG